jgi:hypothetical protein
LQITSQINYMDLRHKKQARRTRRGPTIYGSCCFGQLGGSRRPERVAETETMSIGGAKVLQRVEIAADGSRATTNRLATQRPLAAVRKIDWGAPIHAGTCGIGQLL